MRLSSLQPIIPPDLVASLESRGIRTDVDLVFSASPIEIFRSLPGGTVTLQQLINYTSLVKELCSAPALSGLEMLRREQLAQENDFYLQSGNHEIDALLKELGGRKLIELSGDRGSGKSALALNFVIRYLASSSDNKAIWVDTTGEFSPERVTSLLDSAQISESVLERVQLSLVFDVDTAQELLDELFLLNDPHMRLLIIDSITPLIGPILSAVSAQGHAVMTDFMRRLQSYAQNLGATVIVINNTARKGPDTTERKPALGPSFAHMTHTSIWLEKLIDSDAENNIMSSFRILRSHSLPTERPPIPFRI